MPAEAIWRAHTRRLISEIRGEWLLMTAEDLENPPVLDETGEME
jgi:hypothetical protein